MITPPTAPSPGKPVSASFFARLIAWVKSGQLIDGAGYRLRRTPNGTSIQFEIGKNKPATPVPLPWTFSCTEDPDTGERECGWRNKIIQVAYSIYDYDSELFADKYTDETGGEEGYYFLKLTFDPEHFESVPEAEMVCLSTAPENDWENHIFYVYIGRVDEDGKQTGGSHVVPIIYMYV